MDFMIFGFTLQIRFYGIKHSMEYKLRIFLM